MSNLNLKTTDILPCRITPSNAVIPYLARWQQNNSPNDLGVARFLFDMITLNASRGYTPLFKDFKMKYGIAPWATDALAEYFIFYDGMTKEDRCYVYGTFREGSKTLWFSFWLLIYETLIGQYGIYYQNVLFPEVDYQVLRAKNSDEAKKRLMNISSFLNNPIVHDLFGNLKPRFRQIKDKDAKDTGGLLILNNKYIFEASGIDQPSRGLNLFMMRPKKFTFDDPQNRENTKTPGRREQCDREVMEESFGAVADVGSLVYIGNKTHTDDTLGKLLDPENTQWKKQFHTLTIRITEDGKIEPGVGDLDNEHPAWPARWDIKKVRRRREFFVKQPKMGGLRGFLKEYYNIIRSEVDYKIKYYNAVYERKFGYNWLVFEGENGYREYVNCYIVVSNDPAISEKKSSSDAVIGAVAYTFDFKRYVLEYSSGKFDINDRYYDDKKVNWDVAITPEQVAQIERRGSTGEVIRMYLKYSADAIVIETFGQQGTFFNETKKLLNDKLRKFPTIMPFNKREGSKEDKLKELPLAFFEVGLYYLREEMTKLKNEVETFSSQSRKDHLDMLYLAEQLAQFPAKIAWNPLGIHTKDEFTPVESKEPAIQVKEAELTNAYESWIVY